MRFWCEFVHWSVRPRLKGAVSAWFWSLACEMASGHPREGVSRAPEGKRNHPFHDPNLYMGAWDHVPKVPQWRVSDRRHSRVP